MHELKSMNEVWRKMEKAGATNTVVKDFLLAEGVNPEEVISGYPNLTSNVPSVITTDMEMASFVSAKTGKDLESTYIALTKIDLHPLPQAPSLPFLK